ncbi:class I SAM-dependent methyltransferase [Glaciibacter flavus]|uniref:class I SAM-dependent methyltransferase n=1 Tax=Orlajensenia flava TaxID=2565934 RepID=UPI003B001961
MTDSTKRDYSEWKGWSEGSFGTLSRSDIDYFEREMNRISRGRAARTVLEIGFGDGRFLEFMRALGCEVTGVELLPELVHRAVSAGFRAYRADEPNALSGQQFDLVVALDVLEHIPPEQTVEFLASLKDRLADRGRVVLRFPNADSWLGSPFQNGDPTHVNAIGLMKMQYYAQEAGLRITSFRAPARRGFKSSVIYGIHGLTAAPVIKAAAGLTRALYFPDLKVVLSAGNVVCVLESR